jgi:predicted nucleic acid-binding protein
LTYVLDTSALMRLFLDEPGADKVQAVLEGKEAIFLPFMALMELRYVLLRHFSIDRVMEIVETLRATRARIVESDPDWGVAAAEVKSRGGLSLGDAWIAALALMRSATLVHGDPEFDSVPGLRATKLAATKGSAG